MKVLITGASGLLGSNLVYSLEQTDHQLYYTVNRDNVNFKGKKIRVNLGDGLDKLKRYKYDVIINAVGLTDVDRCEGEPGLSRKINTQIPANLAEYCSRSKCKLIHISTDQIFDGKAKSYDENSVPHPVNMYGETKLAAEEKIMEIMGHNYLILRTNFFGINCLPKQSLSEWVVDSLRQNGPVNMFTDVYFNPLLVNTVALLIQQCMERELSGLYDCTSESKISKYDFGRLIKTIFGLPGEVKPISVKQAKFAAVRPGNMYLDNTKIKRVLGLRDLRIEDEIIALCKLYQENYPAQLKAHYVKN